MNVDVSIRRLLSSLHHSTFVIRPSSFRLAHRKRLFIATSPPASWSRVSGGDGGRASVHTRGPAISTDAVWVLWSLAPFAFCNSCTRSPQWSRLRHAYG